MGRPSEEGEGDRIAESGVVGRSHLNDYASAARRAYAESDEVLD